MFQVLLTLKQLWWSYGRKSQGSVFFLETQCSWWVRLATCALLHSAAVWHCHHYISWCCKHVFMYPTKKTTSNNLSEHLYLISDILFYRAVNVSGGTCFVYVCPCLWVIVTVGIALTYRWDHCRPMRRRTLLYCKCMMHASTSHFLLT